jgi:threonine synthase
VVAATGQDAPLPVRCEALKGKGEVFERAASDLGAVRARVLDFAR